MQVIRQHMTIFSPKEMLQLWEVQCDSRGRAGVASCKLTQPGGLLAGHVDLALQSLDLIFQPLHQHR